MRRLCRRSPRSMSRCSRRCSTRRSRISSWSCTLGHSPAHSSHLHTSCNHQQYDDARLPAGQLSLLLAGTAHHVSLDSCAPACAALDTVFTRRCEPKAHHNQRSPACRTRPSVFKTIATTWLHQSLCRCSPDSFSLVPTFGFATEHWQAFGAASTTQMPALDVNPRIQKAQT